MAHLQTYSRGSMRKNLKGAENWLLQQKCFMAAIFLSLSGRKREKEWERAVLTLGCTAAAPHPFQRLPSWTSCKRSEGRKPERGREWATMIEASVTMALPSTFQSLPSQTSSGNKTWKGRETGCHDARLHSSPSPPLSVLFSRTSCRRSAK